MRPLWHNPELRSVIDPFRMPSAQKKTGQPSEDVKRTIPKRKFLLCRSMTIKTEDNREKGKLERVLRLPIFRKMKIVGTGSETCLVIIMSSSKG